MKLSAIVAAVFDIQSDPKFDSLKSYNSYGRRVT